MTTHFRFSVIILLCISCNASAQQFFEGTIIKNSVENAPVNILNITQRRGAVDDPFGNFKIVASVNDSILFSSVQYKDTVLIVSEENLQKRITIKLEEEVTEIDEVYLRNTNLTGNLALDVKNAGIDYYNNFGFPFPNPSNHYVTPVQRKLGYASSGAINLLINSLNGKIKQLKKHREVEKTDMLVKNVATLFDTEFFTETLDLNDDDIVNFIYFCSYDDDFAEVAKKNTLLPLTDFFLKKRKEYVANN